jgi:flagellar hook-basal body complex protein FliE
MIEGISGLSGLGGSQALASPQAATPAAGGVSFEQALGQAVGSAIDTLKGGESAAIQGVEGATPPMRVVESVMDAQRSLQSVLAIRDKLVSAWQDISRMSI